MRNVCGRGKVKAFERRIRQNTAERRGQRSWKAGDTNVSGRVDR